MHPTESGTTPVWSEYFPEPLHPLTHDCEADVAIVGAGIAGLSVAVALVERGRSVVVLDDGLIGGGETSRTTAHLVTALDRRYFSIERMHGAESAALVAASHGAAIERFEQLSRRYAIECALTRLDGYLFLPPDLRAQKPELIEQEHAAAARAGVPCDILPRTPSLALDVGPCLRFPNQAQFHPMRFLRGLAVAIEHAGSRVYTGSHAQTIKGGRDAHIVTSDGHTVRASAIVVATNTPVNDVVTMHTKQVAHRTYVLALPISRGSFPPALFWDGFWEDHDQPYHYARLLFDPAAKNELLIVGGEDHATGREFDATDRYNRLEQWARSLFPDVGAPEFRWSGQIMEPHDELAFIGRNPGVRDNVFIITGDSGNGMTHAGVAALMLPDLIEGKSHPWERVYAPSRLPTGAAATAASEALGMVAEYRDWVTSHPSDASHIAPGQGDVVRSGARLLAIYRRPDGSLVHCSAVCPHLKGIVRWNASEKSWDCPCHGSRFDCDGRVIAGPANSDLPALEADAAAPAVPATAFYPAQP